MGRRKKLSRGWRTVRNLAIVLICLYALWARADYPLPTAELEFRRLEREYMLPHSEIQGVFEDEGMKGAVIGTRGDQVILRDTIGPVLSFWPRQEAGPTLVPRRFTHFDSWVAAVDVPEEAVSARLALKVSCWYTNTQEADGGHFANHTDPEWEGFNGPPQYWEKDYLLQGERLRQGAFLFRFGEEWIPADSVEWFLERAAMACVGHWNTYGEDESLVLMEVEMEAVFYDAAGGELARAALRSAEEAPPPAGGTGDASSVTAFGRATFP